MLIWPPAKQLRDDTLENRQRLSTADSVLIQNIPLPELRRRQREWIGHDSDKPLIATGHQTELHHPGVWVKNILINAAADKLGGAAFHFAVDTDKPKHLHLRWPSQSHPLTDDDRLAMAQWSGLLNIPTPQHLQLLEQQFHQAAQTWKFHPQVESFLASMKRLSLESPGLAPALTNAMHQLDWDLGLRHHALIVSPIWNAPSYLAMVYHMLARAGKFAAQYNAALADYRHEQGIKTTARPMPDLKISADQCEMPFWLDSLAAGRRTRARVEKGKSGWTLKLPGGEEFLFNEQCDGWTAASQLDRWLRGMEIRLSPRALTLTMFLRLLVADQFVHGIGGGQYDQVTDRLIAAHFGIEPPKFSVTTATLYFPDAIGRQRACLPCVLQQKHRSRHSLLGEEKMRMVRHIAALPRKSLDRSRIFYEMHNKLAVAADHPVRLWEKKLAETQEQAREDAMLFDRELFYAIQPRERLVEMIDRYRNALVDM